MLLTLLIFAVVIVVIVEFLIFPVFPSSQFETASCNFLHCCTDVILGETPATEGASKPHHLVAVMTMTLPHAREDPTLGLRPSFPYVPFRRVSDLSHTLTLYVPNTGGIKDRSKGAVAVANGVRELVDKIKSHEGGFF